jgi:NAD(P)-dependent dehydrogenase (short-subunit alcohol dehydrogenase family)
MPDISSTKTVLIIGASRGLGYAMAEEYLSSTLAIHAA